MGQEKIGFIVDSGSDVPAELVASHHIKVLPLTVTYQDGREFDDGDLDLDQLYRDIDDQSPKTSLPSGEKIFQAFEELKRAGCTHVIATTISSALSGTFNSVRLAALEMADMETFVLDTKSIGIGAGLFMVAACYYLDQGDDFDTICDKLSRSVDPSHIFFHISTLHYLIKGGRIGKVMGTLGSMLKIQPIITCDEEGIYTTVAKFRESRRDNDQRAIDKLLDQVDRVSDKTRTYFVGSSGGSKAAQAKMRTLSEKLPTILPHIQANYAVPVSPVLGVHTGPDISGCAIVPVIED
ncbi:hypothetical protein AWM75_07280 [Aerococcus urinaehominis]|uniref:Uncharacterized protein n=1 Tax=Aerococcus urinaehominis TaxID=128944 RepID=A0A109RI81_9LACT|nr:DegV family protein [Aerococcus urinaehominis]AMB99775.1 hypothetical protein AWM75_07280 [Aerococcus urinaehominis]SDM09415.1 EDD domain protein, DegV family [Aerococcus urinaehominis]